jgi:NAD(P)-dependent dehydrogenase (short-subunit alcohol dehydrogenase family)
MRAIYPDLSNCNVLVTGGASGIGASIVSAFCQQGANVAFIDIDDKGADKLIKEIQAQGLTAPLFQFCNLAELNTIAPVINSLSKELGDFDVLVNNAADDTRHTPLQITPEYWQNRLDINLGQQFFCAQAVYPGMQAKSKGVILNFSSVSYQMALPELTAYATSKAAVVGLTRSLAREWGADNIRVNTVIPGCVMTEKQLKHWISPADEEKIQQQQCLKMRILAEHVADMTLFLASQNAAACTAQSFTIDAGIT